MPCVDHREIAETAVRNAIPDIGLQDDCRTQEDSGDGVGGGAIDFLGAPRLYEPAFSQHD
ncbi:hypothetical protein D3C79_1085830 [compost metagenome]